MKKLLIIFCLFASISVLARSMPDWAKPYFVKYIKGQTDSGAPVRFLYEKTKLEKDGDFVLYSLKKMVKIENIKGTVDYSTVAIPYNASDTVVKAVVYRLDGTGMVRERYKIKDMTDLALSENFVDDSRKLVVTFDSLEKGDVIILEFELKKKDLFQDYFLSFGEDGDILESEIEVKGAKKVAVLNDKNGIVKRDGDIFKIQNVEYIKDRKNMPPKTDLYPVVAACFTGDENSWEEVAKKFWQLARLSLDLTDTSSIELSGELSKSEKVKKVLDFVAKKVNYVDIELGNGRIVPKKCSFVIDRKYGDCKDKSFLAINLLKNLGFDAYPVLAKGYIYGQVYPDFPGIQFNHVIVAVKLDNETANLKNLTIDGTPYLIFDVTDRITEPPFFPSALQGTYGLLVLGDGGKLIKLPVFSEKENKVRIVSKCKLNKNNSASFVIAEFKKGLPAYSEKWFLDGINEDNETKKYNEFIQDQIMGAKLDDEEVKNGLDTVETTYWVSAIDYGIKTTDGILIIPFPMTSKYKNPFRKRTRKVDIVFSKKLTFERNAEWVLPDGYTIVKLPQDVSIDNKYFSFNRHIEFSNGKIIAKAVYVRKAMRIPSSDYKSYRKAYKKYIKSLKSPIVVKNNN
ncbi:conserved hypothetical protein [Thermotomaculum hydrothermale]|uniref:DUF3857 domain-containing protein n=1 Tax=Thermotomaculum hydrothermale TaxID=981385 RepID=A0A7R6PPC0_9BACT|nr:DUF3857 domain-containing protein [Thermotomaculum hydrothermale]BBB33353.1 conserved hypothetical protein [Thermotomaculum hydrothermale]